MRIAILAVGSLGDVRPSAALGAGLVAAGHEVRLATLGAFQGLAASCGLDFAPVDIDPFAFIRGDIGQSWMDSTDKPHRLLLGVSRAAGQFMAKLNTDALAACRGYDALLYNIPLSLSGQTIAEALGILGIPTAVAPYHPTRAFASIITPSLPFRGGVVNWLSGAAALQVLWMMFRSHMNRWRKTQSALSPLPLRHPLRDLTRRGVPCLYGFSPSILPKPADWPDSAMICGYWFTAPDSSWRPPEALRDFLSAGPAPLYVGFGSMVGSNPEQTLETVRQAVQLAGVRAIIASGWGGMRHAALSESVFPIESVPHEWLFPKVAAAVHHGGAGTTAAALRAGIPSVVLPYFYDQFFWGQRLQQLGVAPHPIPQKQVTPHSLAGAIRSVVGSPQAGIRSRAVAARIAKEKGVEEAVSIVERCLLAPLKRTVVGALLILCWSVAPFGAQQQPGDAQVSKPPLSTEQIKTMLIPLDSSMDRIQSLIAQAAVVGAETRYFEVSLAVLKRYRKEVLDMKLAKDPYVMEHTARWLLECAGRTEQGLEEAIRHPKDTIRVPSVNLQKLEVREGGFHSGDRPVLLAGLCGWASPKDYDYLSSIGCTVFAGEMGPASVFPEEGKQHDINALTAVLDAAAQHNMKMDVLLSPHYIPQWAYDKWPDLDPENRRKSNPFMPWDARSPHLKEILTRFLDVLIPQVRNKSALLDYDLINEAWYRPFAHLDDAIVTNFMKAHPLVKREDVPEQYTTEQVTDFMKLYAGEVRKRDARHPIYVKALTSQEVLCVDREALGDTLTANGMDSYPACPDPTGVLAADFAWTLLRIDFHRSLTPGKPILDGEYHPCAGAYDMPDAYFRTAMWAPALHGKSSAALWVYGRVDEVSSDWHANGTEVLGHSALDCLRLAKEIHAFQRQRAPIAVYYGGYHDNYRSAGDRGNGIREAYLASLFQDSDVGMLTEKRVQAGALSRYKVVVLPAGCSLSPDGSSRIQDFRRSGGAVVQCPPKTTAKDLWPVIHSAVGSVGIKELVSADQWGVECRSVKLGGRRIFYLINYRREPVDVQLRSSWPLTEMLELRTQTRLQGDRLHLGPLEFKLLEATSK